MEKEFASLSNILEYCYVLHNYHVGYEEKPIKYDYMLEKLQEVLKNSLWKTSIRSISMSFDAALLSMIASVMQEATIFKIKEELLAKIEPVTPMTDSEFAMFDKVTTIHAFNSVKNIILGRRKGKYPSDWARAVELEEALKNKFGSIKNNE